MEKDIVVALDKLSIVKFLVFCQRKIDSFNGTEAEKKSIKYYALAAVVRAKIYPRAKKKLYDGVIALDTKATL